jgi:DNA primase
MRTLSNTSRSASPSNEPGKVGHIKPAIEDDQSKRIKAKANSVPLKLIFDHYGVKITKYNNIIICPLKRHKGGRENSPSFRFYPETNTFYCYGCKAGIKCCNFVAEVENISVLDAAYRILDCFGSEASQDENLEIEIDHTERLEVLLDFSNMMRDSIRHSSCDEKALNRMETLARAFEKANTVHKLDNEALKSLVLKIKSLNKV